jgi:hypothetical protein
MRKRVIQPVPNTTLRDDQTWVPLEELAQVELTSEDPAYPIESAFRPGDAPGWRAAAPGPQTIRLLFDRPQHLSRIRLVFVESEHPRTQEFVLRWSTDGGQSDREIVRQQWTFSPPEGAREVEDYRVELAGVSVLEFTIVPNISGGDARASLAEMRLA